MFYRIISTVSAFAISIGGSAIASGEMRIIKYGQIEHSDQCYLVYKAPGHRERIKRVMSCEEAIEKFNDQVEEKRREREEILRERERKLEEQREECQENREKLGRALGGVLTDNHDLEELSEEALKNTCH